MNIIRRIFPFAGGGHRAPASEDPNYTRKVFDALIRYSSDAVTILSPELETIYVSPSVERILGRPIEEDKVIDITSILHPADVSIATGLIERIIADPGIPVTGQRLRIIHEDKSWRWIETTITNLIDDPMIGGILCNFRDVTESVVASEKLLYAGRLYSFISQINQAIVHVKTRQLLFEEVCRIAVEQGGFKFAWIGLANTFTREIPMVAKSGATEADLLFFKDYVYTEDGPIAAVFDGLPYCVVTEKQLQKNASFKQYATERGFMSSITLGLKLDNFTIGTLNLYSGEKYFFTPEEIALLLEAVTDLSFALDVFEKEKQRSEAENLLKDSERRLKQSQAIAHVGNWEVNFTTGQALWSEEALRMFGLPTDQPVHTFEDWISFIHPEDLPEVLEIIAESEPTCSDCAFYHRIVCADESIRYIFSQAHYELDGQGKPVGLYGVSHDVTDAKIAELALRQSEKNLRLIIDSIPQAVFARDHNGHFIFVNRNFARLYGCEPNDILDDGCAATTVNQGHLLKLLEYDDKVIKTGMLKVIPELVITDIEENEHVFQVTKLPFVSGTNTVRAVLSIAHDITDQKIADTERSQMVADIVQRNKDLEQFSYIVSHNLRAPAANIIGLTEELSSGLHTEEMNNLLIRELSASATRLDNIITDLNSILRVREIGENREQVDLTALTQSIQESISHLVEQENVNIETDFSQAPIIPIVKSYLYSILYNLISNSIKYRRPESAPQIFISSKRKGNSTQIVYQDNGLGIDMDKRGEQVFGLYKRFHQHVEGKGMGLFMVKTQVETLGGKIMLVSKPGEGCKFTITFGK